MARLRARPPFLLLLAAGAAAGPESDTLSLVQRSLQLADVAASRARAREDNDELVERLHEEEAGAAHGKDDDVEDEELDEEEYGQDELESGSVDSSLYLHFKLASSPEQVEDYQVGEHVEVNLAKCLSDGTWAEGTVMGHGDARGTYNLNITANRPGHQEVLNIPGNALRKRGWGGPRVGDTVEVKVAKCLEGGFWVSANITGLDEQEGTYRIEVYDGSEGSEEVPGVPARALRRKQVP
mmetsp:Transcript_112205/g.350853  ORF Transcript_112205/g.350853 Transcript_112205/m.350853 type:complete len:239 (+) Transcript_112205:50-766(+)